MDMTAYFLILLSALFFFRFLKQQKWHYLYFTAALFAIAVLVKNIVFVMIPAYIITFIVYDLEERRFFFSPERKFILNKKLLLHIFGCILLCVLIVMPVFIYNYFTLQAKGTTDYYFSNMLGIGKTVHVGIADKSWSVHTLGIILQELSFTKMPITLTLGLSGLILLFRRNKTFSVFVVTSILTLLLYVGGKTASPSHYLWIPLALSLYAAKFLIFIKERFFEKIEAKYFFSVVFLFFFLFNMVRLHDVLSTSSATLQLNDFVSDEMPKNAIVVIDPRIYRGIHAWVFNERHYLDGQLYPQLSEIIGSAPPEQKETVPFYYVECGKGTNCGWKEEDFQRVYNFSEQLSQQFKEVLKPVEQFKEIDTFNIYSGVISIPPSAYDTIDQTHNFWFYSVGWKYPRQNKDYYEVKGSAAILQEFGLLILYLDVLVVLGTIPLLIYWVIKSKEEI